MRRGDVRDLLLAALVAGPAHGYELMSRLEEAAGGRWRPSPGSVYPSLLLLEDEGLVRGVEDSGRKVYELTAAGTERADRGRLAELAADDGPLTHGHQELRDSLMQLRLAAKQVALAGDPAQVTAAATIVRTARQSLYRLLADGE